MILLSATGTLRLILILLILWMLLRMVVRARQGEAAGRKDTRWARDEQRPRGEVRIERAGEERRERGRGPVEDVDFEEIR